MDYRTKLLWIDCCSGLLAGLIVLVASRILANCHSLPVGLIVFTGVANLAYGSFSLSLALRQNRPMTLIKFLAWANILWAVACIVFMFTWNESISLSGRIHLVGEGIYVGGLGLLEWRNRNLLTS